MAGPALRRALRLAPRLAAAALLLPVGLFLLAALILGAVPINLGWHEPAPGAGTDVTIYVQTNGVHTGIVVPAVAAGIDWRNRARAADLGDPSRPGAWLAFGWGDRDFYLATPHWQDVRLGTLVRASAGLGTTLVHVDHLDAFVADANWRPIRLRAGEYRRLASVIAASVADWRLPIAGYTDRDVFYPGTGHYSLLTTCNVWTGRMLGGAGVRVGAWTPFAAQVMAWVPKP